MDGTDSIRIGQPTIEDDHDGTTWSCPVTGHPAGSRLTFQIDRSHRELVTSTAEPAALALLIPALERGQDLVIEGVTDPQFLVTVRDEVVPLYAHFLGAEPIRLDAEAVEAGSPPTEGGLTGFTGGIDSFSTVVRSVGEPPSSPYALSHLVFSSVGDGDPSELRDYRAHFDRVRPLAEEFGLPLIRVESDMGRFFQDKRYMMNHTPRNVAVGLLFQGGIRHFHYSTGYSHWESSNTDHSRIAKLDPVAVPLMSTSRTRTHPAMAYLTRFERTELLVGSEAAQRGLHVCQRSDSTSGNCSTCKKCVRMMLSLEVLGALERFAGAFDLTGWSNRRERAWAVILATDDAFGAELMEQAQLRDFPIPTMARLAARTPQPLRRLARVRRRTGG